MNLSLINNGCVKEEGIANSVFGKLSDPGLSMFIILK